MTNTLADPNSDPGTGLPVPDWSRSAVFLDFDGTLAPIAPRPDDVRLRRRERALVDRLLDLTEGAVAILTGRDLAVIEAYFEGLPVSLAGSHGAEIAVPGRSTLRPAEDGVLANAFGVLSTFATQHELLLERKAGALALHYRSNPELESKVLDLVDRLALSDPGRLKPLHGRKVSEITLRGYDKGTALDSLMQYPPFASRNPVAIGDDTTDEDAFRAAQARGGLGLRIGAVPSSAQHRFPDRDAFIDWLEATTRDT
ncbi:trehalose-phosphatase [Cribrihabitans sp. XS_ASV171]